MNLQFTIYNFRLALPQGRDRESVSVPQGRQKFSFVPPGLDFLGCVFPPLKRRAIFGRHVVTA
jgi:hypothetical protein